MSKPLLSKPQQKIIAQQRIKQLFHEAELVFSKNKLWSNRYVALARKIAMKVKLKMPGYYKRKFCKHCYSYLQPGINSRTRIRSGKVIIYCWECKKFTRIPLR